MSAFHVEYQCCDAGDTLQAQIAQLVEQRTENPRVTGSIPVLGTVREAQSRMKFHIFITCGCSSMVEHQPSKLDTWVRFPSPALLFCSGSLDFTDFPTFLLPVIFDYT